MMASLASDAAVLHTTEGRDLHRDQALIEANAEKRPRLFQQQACTFSLKIDPILSYNFRHTILLANIRYRYPVDTVGSPPSRPDLKGLTWPGGSLPPI